MSILCVSCPNCGNTVQTSSLNGDGVCPRCESGRVSSPPPPAPVTINVACSAKKRYDRSSLYRQPLASKIPLAEFIKRNPVFPPAPALPREASRL